MAKRLTPDICVIGAGSGGLTVAAAAAAFGVPVVLVERGKMGGDCLNYGCVPSKSLIAAGKRAHAMRHASPFGIGDHEPAIDFAGVHRHIHDVIAAIEPNDSEERFTALGVHVIKAHARFTSPRTVVAGDHEICARRFVIATGSRPAIPAIPGLDTVGYLTNETIFDLTEKPAELVIVGGGPVGLELAQAYRRLGSRVTIVEAAAALSREDPELAAIVLDRLRDEGIDLRERTRILRAERRDNSGVRLTVAGENGAEETIEGTHCLVATGRTPNLDGLGLEAAGIRHTPRGVEVSDTLRTSNRRVYAIGDAAGGPQFTHLANYHAGIVLRAILFRIRKRQDLLVVPRATFTDPELAHVGLSEAEATASGHKICALRWPYAENDRAQAERATTGFIKIVLGRGGRILGASIVGAQASEFIGIWSLAVAKGMKIRDMTAYIAPYPTLGEIGKRAAISYFGQAARKPSVQRIVRFLRIFG